jgi:hypothetical protein
MEVIMRRWNKMVKCKIHEESAKQYCFVEVELEANTEDELITSYIAFLSKLRLAHASLVENGIEGDIKASEKQLATIRRLAKEQNKELPTILDYVAKKFRTPSLPGLTKEEASHLIDLMMPKKEEK